MRNHVICLFILSVVSVGFGSEANRHPSIYGSNSTKENLREKIEKVSWAGEIYRQIKKSVDPYVDRHAADPEWIVSRLQMHWKTHYTDIYVNGAVWSHGSGRAPVATPRFAGGRDWHVDFARPRLEDVRPYAEDERGIWLQNIKKEGRPWEWAPVSETGQIIEKINEEILGLAEKSAFLYWYTGEEKYAHFSADILWTYVNGMYCRKNPQTYENHKNSQILGLATFEVIHENIVFPLTVSYDCLYDYLIKTGRDVTVVQSVFRRWADRIIEGGFAQGNWNINQAKYIVYLGLCLENDTAYENGRGRQYYIDRFTTESSANQRALREIVPETYDPVTGVWPEAPGYAFSVTDNILKLAQVIYNATGDDILEDYPVIVPAAAVVAQYLFPNGYTVGFGDAYHEQPFISSLELLLARFRRIEDAASTQQIAGILRDQIRMNGYRRDSNNTLLALTSYVDELPPAKPSGKPLQTRTFYADNVNFLAQRNANNAEDGLMLSLAGTCGGHMHANGMALELYGKGMVLGPDPGRGPSYWTRSHGEFYRRFAAHNTVVVDGISDYNPNQSHSFRILAMEPAAGSCTSLSGKISFSDTEFIEPATHALQRRLLSLIRTSDSTGYYVDVFRSRRCDGNDRKHEYIYHNIGQKLHVLGMNGQFVPMHPTKELGSVFGDHKGYDYFTDKLMAEWNDDFYAVFNVDLAAQKDVCMRMWMMGQDGRKIFTAQSPVARSAGRGSVPKELRQLPIPTVIVQQEGEAWNKPFVAVFEPCYQKEGSSLDHIRPLMPPTPSDSFVGIAVETKANSTQYILNSTDETARNICEGIVFAGTYGVIDEDADGMRMLYLGRGRVLLKDGVGIDGMGKSVSASLKRNGDRYFYSSDSEITITFKKTKTMLPASNGAEIGF